MEACRACCAPRFWSGCARGSRRRRPMAACGPAAKWRPVVQPQSGGLDGRRTRARGGLAPPRLGAPEGDRLVRPEAPPPPPCRGHARGAGGVQKKLEQAVAEERAQHPDTPVEVWATDEHRIGLKPILGRVWAPKGQRPIALVWGV